MSLMRPEDFWEIPIKWFAAYRGRALVFSHPHDDRAHTALTKPAPYASKEVLTVIKNFQTSLQAGIAMPVSWPDAVSAAAVRTLPTTGGVSADAAVAGTKRRFADVASVCTYTHITDVVVLEGAFPGTSAWSPPI
jgi:hypothetical protein